VQISNLKFNVQVSGEGEALVWGHGLTASLKSEDLLGISCHLLSLFFCPIEFIGRLFLQLNPALIGLSEFRFQRLQAFNHLAYFKVITLVKSRVSYSSV
jgi:hypothetical protein